MNDLTPQYNTQIYPTAGPSNGLNTCTPPVTPTDWSLPPQSTLLPPNIPSQSPTTSGPSSGGPGPLRRRRFSAARIQPTRIKKVMQADEEIGRMVASVPVAIGKAMEHFAEKFLLASAQVTQTFNSRTLTPVHMKMAMLNTPCFRFLENTMKEIGIPGRAMETEAFKLSSQAMYSPTNNQEQYPHIEQVLSPVPTQGNFVPHMPFAFSGTTGVPAYEAAPILQSEAVETIAKKATARKSVDAPDSDKPKRGRPKKKKDDKCIDEALCAEATHCIEQEDKDRELMPPPPLPIGINRAKPLA
ncbi:unnamed protein product [Auanema sp. JU1783]|nr:unnamed protein product [Auanema sp. JU1783]